MNTVNENIVFCLTPPSFQKRGERIFSFILDSQAKHDDVEICKSSCSYVFIYTRKVCR